MPRYTCMRGGPDLVPTMTTAASADQAARHHLEFNNKSPSDIPDDDPIIVMAESYHMRDQDWKFRKEDLC